MKAVLCTSVMLLLACTTYAQTPNDQGTTPTANQTVAVTPETAVPNAQDGKDPYGRPITPVGTAQSAVQPPVAPDQKQQFSDNVKDIFFDFNRADLRADDQQVLQQDADWLKAHPEVVFTIAGQADPRGDIVYNLSLSDQRALATRDALVKLGVPENQILFAQGWGKLYQVCGQDDESCWQQERRAHLEAWSLDAGPLTGGQTSSGAQ